MQKVCIVTGGANGIGRRITEEFLKQGSFVYVIDTDEISGYKLAQIYNDTCFCFFCGDITEQKVIDRFIEDIIKHHTKIDVLVNNACISRGGLKNCTYDDFNYVLRLGVTAPYYLTQRLIPYFNTLLTM
jgi:NAD(P)-dependent dehydrogenase (short-subunit alcohol dehydrogenase family)